MHCAVATPEDDAAIRRLLRDNAMGGAIRLTLEREPDYFLGANVAGGADQTILVSRGSQLVCVGRCTRRKCWINGEPRSVGYLAELRLDHSLRGRAAYLRRGYQFFETCQAGADVYFTSIASDNHRAIRFLESGVRGLPRYEYLGELTTILIHVPKRPHRIAPHIRSASTEDELLRLLNAPRHQFAAVWTDLAELARHGLPMDQFHVVSRDGKAVACGALWDQRAFRQTVIQSYGRPLALARPFLNWISQTLGRPGLPQPGSVLPHGFLSPIACEAEDDLHALIESFFPVAASRGLQFLTLAFPANDARLHGLQRRYHTRAWSSRLYRVDWPGKPLMELDPKRMFLPDVALL